MKLPHLRVTFAWTALVSLLLGACMPAAETAAPSPSATNTVTATLPPTSTPSPTWTATVTPSPSPTATATPGPRPVFSTKLPAEVTPAAYIQDTCQVLAMRWDPQNSIPGTIVVPVMIHSIAKPGKAVSDDSTVTEEYFLRFIDYAQSSGFQTITTAQLVEFLTKNANIPAKSLLLIVDDRKRGEYFHTYFDPLYKKYGWTVTNAWIANPDTPAYLWKENEPFALNGEVDFQAHGVVHNIPLDDSVTAEYIHSEIYGPIQPMTEHFGNRPIAYIWPRGLFTPQAVQVARQAGYQVGFTTLPRGPLLFNWIPQGPQEMKTDDPLMVLPRYWDTTAIAALTEAMKIGEAAQNFYAGQRASDLAYYRQYCPGYPIIP